MLKGFLSYTTSDMKIFHCDHCGHLLFFENTECMACGRRVAYLPDLRLVGSLDPAGSGNWRSPLPRAAAAATGSAKTTKLKGSATGRCPRTTTTRCACRVGSRV